MLNKGKNQCVKIVHKGNNSDILMYATCLFLERHVFVYKLSLKEWVIKTSPTQNTDENVKPTLEIYFGEKMSYWVSEERAIACLHTCTCS